MKSALIYIEVPMKFLNTIAIALAVLVTASAHGASEEAADLATVLKAVKTHNAQIQEAEQDIEIARAELDQAIAAAWPHGEAVFLGAPMPQMKGNAQSSSTNWSRWGTFLSAGAQVVQPLFTFGQLSNYKLAARKQIEAKSGLAGVRRLEVIFSAKEFYYSYLMAGELLSLVEDLIGTLEEAVETAEQSRKEAKGGVKPHDLYRLKTALDDLKQKRLAAEAGKKTAERAVVWISADQVQKLPKPVLSPEVFEKDTLENYLDVARANRPEYEALKSGIGAYEALADAKQAQSYPTVFVGLFGQANWSNVADKQPSFFLNDPFNRLQGGGGVGVKFDLELIRHSAEAAEQRAEAMKLRATERFAVPGIELQVKRAFWEVEQGTQGLEIATRRRDTAKKWFVSNTMGWSIGVTDAKDLLESLEGHGLARRNYIETLFQYNVALAKLSQAVGRETTALKY